MKNERRNIFFGEKNVVSSEEDKFFNVWLCNYYMELGQIRHFIKLWVIYEPGTPEGT